MHIIFPIIGASILVFFGYFAIWSSSQPSTPKGVSSFGRILAIILFVIAGLALVSPIASRHFHRGYMAPKSECYGNPSFMGCPQSHWMNKMHMRGEKGEMEPAPQPKSETPPAK